MRWTAGEVGRPGRPLVWPLPNGLVVDIVSMAAERGCCEGGRMLPSVGYRDTVEPRPAAGLGMYVDGTAVCAIRPLRRQGPVLGADEVLARMGC